MKKQIYNILIIVFAAVFLVSAGFLVKYYYEASLQKSEYDDLANLRQDAPAAVRPSVSENQTEVTTAPENPLVEISHPVTGEKVLLLAEFSQLYQKNPDLIGWITIPGTTIDYPVMQTPENKDYYLTRNFDKEASKWGCIYAKEEADVFAPSDNITLYGHRMKDGSMFGKLDKFLDADFCEKNPYIYFDTLTALQTYQILAVFTTTATQDEGFAYHGFIEATNKEDFDQFISNCKALAIYDTGITAEYGDKLITLSTCEYTHTNGRLVVVAKKVS